MLWILQNKSFLTTICLRDSVLLIAIFGKIICIPQKYCRKKNNPNELCSSHTDNKTQSVLTISKTHGIKHSPQNNAFFLLTPPKPNSATLVNPYKTTDSASLFSKEQSYSGNKFTRPTELLLRSLPCKGQVWSI